MSELELLFRKILVRYPAQSKLELKIIGAEPRPEYNDWVIRRRYVLTVDMDMVVSEEYYKDV